MMFLGLRKLGNICCGHKMFLNKIRKFFCVPDTKFVSVTNVARAGKRGNSVSATMCPQRCVLVFQGLGLVCVPGYFLMHNFFFPECKTSPIPNKLLDYLWTYKIFLSRADSKIAGFAGYVWTEAVSKEKKNTDLKIHGYVWAELYTPCCLGEDGYEMCKDL